MAVGVGVAGGAQQAYREDSGPRRQRSGGERRLQCRRQATDDRDCAAGQRRTLRIARPRRHHHLVRRSGTGDQYRHRYDRWHSRRSDANEHSGNRTTHGACGRRAHARRERCRPRWKRWHRDLDVHDRYIGAKDRGRRTSGRREVENEHARCDDHLFRRTGGRSRHVQGQHQRDRPDESLHQSERQRGGADHGLHAAGRHQRDRR